MPDNIFADDWQDCLQAHYTHVIRTKDRVTLPSLTVVMHQAGYTDAQLAELRVRATMRVEDAPKDFVPDLDALNHASEAAAAQANAEVHVFPVPDMPATPAVDTVADSAPDAQVVDEASLVAAEQPEALAEEALSEDQLAVLEDELLSGEDFDEEEPQEDEPDEPQQLSLF